MAERRCYLSLDVPRCDAIRPHLSLWEKYGARVEEFKAVGPAGGDQVVYLSFEKKEQALALLAELYPEDHVEFSEGRVYERITA